MRSAPDRSGGLARAASSRAALSRSKTAASTFTRLSSTAQRRAMNECADSHRLVPAATRTSSTWRAQNRPSHRGAQTPHSPRASALSSSYSAAHSEGGRAFGQFGSSRSLRFRPITAVAARRRAATSTPSQPMRLLTWTPARPIASANLSRSFSVPKTRLTVLDENRRARHRAAPRAGACASKLVVLTPLVTSTSSRSSSVLPELFSADGVLDEIPPWCPTKYLSAGFRAPVTLAHSAHACRFPLARSSTGWNVSRRTLSARVTLASRASARSNRAHSPPKPSNSFSSSFSSRVRIPSSSSSSSPRESSRESCEPAK